MLFSLALVWGSSFILMDLALHVFSPIQVGAIRMVLSAFFLLIIGFKKLQLIQKKHWKYIFINAVLGTFFPVFLFAYAIAHIDSGIVAILNSLTPLLTLILGFLFFSFLFVKRQIIGISIGLLGTIYLIYASATVNPTDNYYYALLVVIASLGYAFNANILKKYLNDLDATAIAVGNFTIVLIPASIVLLSTDFISYDFTDKSFLKALVYLSVLAFLGTALAKIFFNRLVQLSSPVFASSVTYIIPIVAVFWGIRFGETLHFTQVIAGFMILIGVYLVNKKN